MYDLFDKEWSVSGINYQRAGGRYNNNISEVFRQEDEQEPNVEMQATYRQMGLA